MFQIGEPPFLLTEITVKHLSIFPIVDKEVVCYFCFHGPH
jgi:hypothetical protein